MELRKDYILDRYVLISAARGKRPKEFKEEVSHPVSEGPCFFCPGNEAMTPNELGRLGGNAGWQLRWFENKFPALKQEGQAEIRTDNRFFTFSAGYGHHLVLVETPDHNKQLSGLSIDEITSVLKVYSRLIKELGSKPNIKYVNVFKNSGYHAGTSIVHTHSQIMATNFLPTLVREEITAVRKFMECPYCKIVEDERKSARRCFENNDFVAFAPYASRYNYEIWVFPKKHATGFEGFNESEMKSLASIMKRILEKIKELGASYNYVIHYSPNKEDLHFHIEVCPRIGIWGGFEIGTNAIINSVPPEDAAAFYRGEL